MKIAHFMALLGMWLTMTACAPRYSGPLDAFVQATPQQSWEASPERWRNAQEKNPSVSGWAPFLSGMFEVESQVDDTPIQSGELQGWLLTCAIEMRFRELGIGKASKPDPSVTLRLGQGLNNSDYALHLAANDTQTAFLSAPLVTLRKGDEVHVEIANVNMTSAESILNERVRYDGTLPLRFEAPEKNTRVTCYGLSPSRVQLLVRKPFALAWKEILRLNKRQQNVVRVGSVQPHEGRLAKREIRKVAAWVGWQDPRVQYLRTSLALALNGTLK
jgi:hypothetical protein